MLYCLVDSIKRKDPDADIVMIDLFPTLQPKQKEIYQFTICNMHIRSLLRMAFPILKLLVSPKPISDDEKVIKKHFKEASIVLDISGYGVSSHNQKALWTYATLFPVKLAKKNKVPFVFMPQSIGPFQFTGWKKLIIWPLIIKYLKYPQKIFIREPECRSELNKIRTKGVIDSYDLVLMSNKLEFNHIYQKQYSEKQIDIANNAVIIIPNKQLSKLSNTETIIDLFTKICNKVIANNHPVVLLRHSSDDKQLCDAIARNVHSEKIQSINTNLSPYQIQEIMNQAAAVISARYHGLIHALKLSKPCLVVGWANKYDRVMRTFDIEDLYFDIRNTDTQKVMMAIDKLLNEKESISNSISKTLTNINNKNLLD